MSSSALLPMPRSAVAALLVVALAVVAQATAPPARALPPAHTTVQLADTTTSTDGTERPTVTADALPTVQIDGVAWDQEIVGNTVYVGGSFTEARQPGAAVGSGVARHNLLAYDIRTGQLVTSFAPVLDGQVLSLALSPDGSRLYAGGDFQKVDGQWRVRIAAWDTGTGALVSSFRPTLSSRVAAVAVTDTTVYAGGNFLQAAGVTGGALTPRSYVAAFAASDGALKPFVTDADAPATALTVDPAAQKLVVGGRFTHLNGADAYGLGWSDLTTGEVTPMPANRELRNAGTKSALTSLMTASDGIYGTGYHFGSGGNVEGSFRIALGTGELVWVADCHGDSYAAFPHGDAVYVASHSHYCGNLGGFPETSPRTHHHATAFTREPAGISKPDPYGYPDQDGEPAPAQLTWFPKLAWGSYTEQGQAAWTITGNADYVAFGGEFPAVNETLQQGLVRFARPPAAPAKRGPSATGLALSATSPASGVVRVGYTTTSDQDDLALTYTVHRGTADSEPVHESTHATPYWLPKNDGFVETSLEPGTTQRYRLTVTDPDGNVARTPWVEVQVSDTGVLGAYGRAVYESAPAAYWRLDETQGTLARDWAGTTDLTLRAGATPGAPSALPTGSSADFNGTTSGYASASEAAAVAAPQVFSAEAWFRSTSRRGGKILGFGSGRTGTSGSYDRHLYLDDGGRLRFGVHSGAARVVQSGTGLNDGAWHHVVGTLGAAGMALYVDGALVASDPTTTSAQDYSGFWRVGGDNLNGWTGSTPSDYLDGQIDEVAVYQRALAADEVARHHAVGTGANVPPTARFGASATKSTASFDATASSDDDGSVAGWAWDFGDGTTGSGVEATHTYAEPGTYDVTLTVTDDSGATGSVTRSVVVPGNAAPEAAFATTLSGLTAAFDGTASTDPDDDGLTYAWDFGDGSTGTGAQASHTYTEPGTYQVTLTVTDSDGASGSIGDDVTVTTVLVHDDFDRTATGGWGTAPSGGSWVLAGAPSKFSVADGSGRITFTVGGDGPRARLDGEHGDVDLTTGMSFSALPNTGGVYGYLLARTSGSTRDYRTKVRVLANGGMRLEIGRFVGGADTSLGSVVTLPGTYAPGTELRVRMQATGSGTTALRAKVWPAGTSEPAAWQIERTDTTAELQEPGGVGLGGYLGAAVTNVPLTLSYPAISVEAVVP
ncbi:PKD domain-containing protein [Promicromonospora iranensis]|uniref:PKD repeat protein n=1 Tax=Promicromonospora iranensis TaxID=1105144 RepID=A0ABU2CMA3_9MICO|nr:PKD domain-containing protein [Promicromonospora iranensis]MDR7382451.1 PKD repeat protein [Promicromonospora iranensis]